MERKKTISDDMQDAWQWSSEKRYLSIPMMDVKLEFLWIL